ncbi:hypothetical protein GUJ93_ZPchr0013g36273 [Zizania palustris]|uniref:Uncharacterized protein n=1 Tax=Zizania palustris TaxID=103762 RepID=A0A8J5X4D0_ZIZPA|nr:hypothetical protein GUJ93_ZPchr0013g36273 [Zizania palustris]
MTGRCGTTGRWADGEDAAGRRGGAGRRSSELTARASRDDGVAGRRRGCNGTTRRRASNEGVARRWGGGPAARRNVETGCWGR